MYNIFCFFAKVVGNKNPLSASRPAAVSVGVTRDYDARRCEVDLDPVSPQLQQPEKIEGSTSGPVTEVASVCGLTVTSSGSKVGDRVR